MSDHAREKTTSQPFAAPREEQEKAPTQSGWSVELRRQHWRVINGETFRDGHDSHYNGSLTEGSSLRCFKAADAAFEAAADSELALSTPSPVSPPANAADIVKRILLESKSGYVDPSWAKIVAERIVDVLNSYARPSAAPVSQQTKGGDAIEPGNDRAGHYGQPPTNTSAAPVSEEWRAYAQYKRRKPKAG